MKSKIKKRYEKQKGMTQVDGIWEQSGGHYSKKECDRCRRWIAYLPNGHLYTHKTTKGAWCVPGIPKRSK